MIYEAPPPDAPVRQGDIFHDVPKPSFSMEQISILTEDNQAEATTWEELRGTRQPVTAIVGIVAVTAIVITQDCDTIRAPEISLCEIKPFLDVVRVTSPKTDRKWTELLRTHAIQNLKWFYLPPDPRLGFSDRMAVDFQSVLRIPRTELERARHLRIGRLNSVGDEHFRERLAEFFRRYPYNEWYPFTKAEFEAYRSDHPQETTIIQPYDYQK